MSKPRRKHCGKLLLFSIFCLLSIASMAQKTGNKEYYLKKFFDPNLPASVKGEDKEYCAKLQIKNIEDYFKIQTAFPVMECTGDASRDEALYQEKLNQWFELNPFFPILVSGGGYISDTEATAVAKAEWIKRNPEKYKELFDLVYSDEKLKKEYLSKIKIK